MLPILPLFGMLDHYFGHFGGPGGCQPYPLRPASRKILHREACGPFGTYNWACNPTYNWGNLRKATRETISGVIIPVRSSY